MKIVLLTGPGGDAQGWGDMKVTESMRQACRIPRPSGPDRLRRRRGGVLSVSSTRPTSTSSGARSTTSPRTRPSSAGTPRASGWPTSSTSGRSPTSARTAGR
ncbi:MAG: hypothetical protein M0C28_38040 [Candidatus Moduliflexus flocculans]|nr:hypothetical protein [Candidatus Moduliflexus flocculans]